MSLPSDDISAVAIKLPPFWISKPELWFVQIEAQFATRNITSDITKYNYAVAALDSEAASEVEALLLNPPTEKRYDALKSALISAFGKSQQTKDNELLSLSGLGDRKPSALLRYIRSLNSDPETLLRAFFMAQLPTQVRQILSSLALGDLEEVAKKADAILEASECCSIESNVSSLKPNQQTDAAVSRSRNQKDRSFNELCFFHKKFGLNARRCKGGNCPQNPNSGNERTGR